MSLYIGEKIKLKLIINKAKYYSKKLAKKNDF